MHLTEGVCCCYGCRRRQHFINWLAQRRWKWNSHTCASLKSPTKYQSGILFSSLVSVVSIRGQSMNIFPWICEIHEQWTKKPLVSKRREITSDWINKLDVYFLILLPCLKRTRRTENHDVDDVACGIWCRRRCICCTSLFRRPCLSRWADNFY